MSIKLYQLKCAIDNLEGEPIPFNLIKHSIQPLVEWLNEVAITEDFAQFSKESVNSSATPVQQLKAEIAEVWPDLAGLAVKNDIDQAIIVDSVERLKQLSAV